MIAGQWADEVADQEWCEMASAVRWCLAESPRALRGEQWRRDLANRVIQPVQDCYDRIKT